MWSLIDENSVVISKHFYVGRYGILTDFHFTLMDQGGANLEPIVHIVPHGYIDLERKSVKILLLKIEILKGCRILLYV